MRWYLVPSLPESPRVTSHHAACAAKHMAESGTKSMQTGASATVGALRPDSPALKLTLCVSHVESGTPDLGQWGQHDKLEGFLQEATRNSSSHAKNSPEEARAGPNRTLPESPHSPSPSHEGLPNQYAHMSSSYKGTPTVCAAADSVPESPAGNLPAEDRAYLEANGDESVHGKPPTGPPCQWEEMGNNKVPIEVYNGLMKTMGVDVDCTPDAQPTAQPMFRGASTVKVFWSESPLKPPPTWLRRPSLATAESPTGLRADTRPATTSSAWYRPASRVKVGTEAINTAAQLQHSNNYAERLFSHGAQERGAGKTLLLTPNKYRAHRRSSAVSRSVMNLAPSNDSLRDGISGTRTTINRARVPSRRTQSALDRHDAMDTEGPHPEWSAEAEDLLQEYSRGATHRPVAESSSMHARREIEPAGLALEWQLARRLATNVQFCQPSKSVQIAAKKASGLRKGAGTIARASLHTTNYGGVYGFLNRHSGDIPQLALPDLCQLLPPDLKMSTLKGPETGSVTQVKPTEGRHRASSAPLWRNPDLDFDKESEPEDGERAQGTSPISPVNSTLPAGLDSGLHMGSPAESTAPCECCLNISNLSC